MGCQFTGKEYVLTGSAVPLTTALGLSAKIHFSHGAIRARDNNAADVVIGKSDVTATTNRLAFLNAGEAFEFALEGQWISTDEIYVNGTAGDTIHIALVV